MKNIKKKEKEKKTAIQSISGLQSVFSILPETSIKNMTCEFSIKCLPHSNSWPSLLTFAPSDIGSCHNGCLQNEYSVGFCLFFLSLIGVNTQKKQNKNANPIHCLVLCVPEEGNMPCMCVFVFVF